MVTNQTDSVCEFSSLTGHSIKSSLKGKIGNKLQLKLLGGGGEGFVHTNLLYITWNIASLVVWTTFLYFYGTFASYFMEKSV